MTKLRQHIEGVRARLTEIAKGELALVQALSDALSRVDEQLLCDVRHVAAEHEVRRGAILSELETLASRIGSFPAVHEPLAALGSGDADAFAAPTVQQSLAGGDWREAARNIDDDLDFLDTDVRRNGYASAAGTMHINGEIRFGRA